MEEEEKRKHEGNSAILTLREKAMAKGEDGCLI